MINYDAIKNSTLINSPFKYSKISMVLNEKDAKLLRNNLPNDNFFYSVRKSGSDKTYTVVNNILLHLENENTNLNESLPTVWQKFLQEITSEKYKVVLSALIGVDVSKCHQEITLKIYNEGDFLSCHTDREEVKATHMFFLNEEWNDAWGGQLVFTKAKNSEPFIEFAPLWTQSVVFVRSDNSWHYVPMITAPQAKRIALQVAFWNVNYRAVQNGRIEKKL
jgi:SM-20-related protein